MLNWKELTETQRQEAAELLARSNIGFRPSWYDGKGIDEVVYANEYLQCSPMLCINEILYYPDGTAVNELALKNAIANDISPFVAANISRIIDNIISTIKIKSYKAAPEPKCDRVHVANGTYHLGSGFSPDKEFSLNRLPIAYNADANTPMHWLDFIQGLLYEEDINTLQEFMGYCLIPSNKAQKMLLIIGNGGEGKSRIGLILQKLLGPMITQYSVCDLERDRFAKAGLLNKLVMFDDDMAMEALPDTHKIKSIITLEGNTDIEFKGKQSFQAPLYSRIIAVGNGTLASLHDRSDGFYRRQLILTAKPVPPGRVNDPYLIDKLKDEIDGIFNWCLEGLIRIVKRNFQFTISDRAKDNLNKAMEEGNNVLSFLNSEGYVYLESGTHASSKDLFNVYLTWCNDNGIKAFSQKTLTTQLRTYSEKYGLEYSTNIDIGGGKKGRGFFGIHTQIKAERPGEPIHK